ncbi:hypothetical protein BaRGS_00005855 [Batillaria attramentaria]|uniref:Uncharacterized protein n=1 Tax=Batillaria attramentaria TaxID=370345 RepID=A0ABD0LV08_9CAEN
MGFIFNCDRLMAFQYTKGISDDIGPSEKRARQPSPQFQLAILTARCTCAVDRALYLRRICPQRPMKVERVSCARSAWTALFWGVFTEQIAYGLVMLLIFDHRCVDWFSVTLGVYPAG